MAETSANYQINRRDFLKFSGIFAIAAVLAGCDSAPAEDDKKYFTYCGMHPWLNSKEQPGDNVEFRYVENGATLPIGVDNKPVNIYYSSEISDRLIVAWNPNNGTPLVQHFFPNGKQIRLVGEVTGLQLIKFDNNLLNGLNSVNKYGLDTLSHDFKEFKADTDKNYFGLPLVMYPMDGGVTEKNYRNTQPGNFQLGLALFDFSDQIDSRTGAQIATVKGFVRLSQEAYNGIFPSP